MLTVLVLIIAIGSNLAICTDPEKDLTGKVVIVTGAAQGIGYAITDNFLKQGVKYVIILDKNETKGAEAAYTFNCAYGEGKAVFIKCDVTTDLEEVSKHILETYDYVDVLVNNAGILDEDEPRKVITTNTIALIEWSMKFRELMRKDNGGCGGTIINLSSIYGYYIDPFAPTYKAAKYGVIGFTKSLGHEYNYRNTSVRVVTICPGFTYTAMTAQQNLVWDEQAEDFAKVLRNTQWQSADDVGKCAVQIFQTAKTGTAWDVIGGNPPTESPLSATLTLADIEAA